jgi:hypothetical protein
VTGGAQQCHDRTFSSTFGGRSIGRVELIVDTAVVRRQPRAGHWGLKEGGVLTQLDTDHYHSANSVGAVIWSLADGQTFPDTLNAGRVFPAEPLREFAEDMAEVIEALGDRKLFDVLDPEPA